eukprot:CAMPEP_0172763092 /NCGR_PEP_ID=MMETSP1074-20121228/174701_1 /TAXON_ID=2916 /ORGANISM="Ceratium fusus, Strain PA161109" /LENGTH=32 /DNA_ID= /DNA_START= /DNA_END= /DNA_ORIENTATION=
MDCTRLSAASKVTPGAAEAAADTSATEPDAVV